MAGLEKIVEAENQPWSKQWELNLNWILAEKI